MMLLLPYPATADYRKKTLEQVSRLLEEEVPSSLRGPVSWQSEIGKKIQEFRDSQYHLVAPYLKGEFQNSIESRLALDERSFHFASVRDDTVQGALRLTPAAFEMAELSDELKQASQHFSGYLEISRLLTTKTLRRQLVGEKLLLNAGYWACTTTEYKGFIAICRKMRRSSFERYGLVPFNEQLFKIPFRGDSEYYLLWANFDMILKAALRITS